MTKDWSIKNLYYYLVCLVTLFMIVGGFVSAVNSAASIFLPNLPNVPLIQAYHPTYRGEPAEPALELPPLEELEQTRAEQEERETYFQSWAWQRLLNSAALILIAAPFFFYHWRRIKP